MPKSARSNRSHAASGSSRSSPGMASLAASALTAPARTGLTHLLRGRPAVRAAKGALGLFVLLAAWQLSVTAVDLPETFYPPPTAVWAAFVELMEKGILLSYIADSLARYAVGLTVGTAIGIGVGLLLSLVPFL